MKNKSHNKLNTILNKFKKIEPYFYILFTIINALPILIYKFFPTVDGPAHLYNSKIIVELLTTNNNILSQFYMFSSNINPNWTGHIILSSFLSFMPGFMAEKILLIIYIIGFPLSFRLLFRTLKLETNYLIYFIFPFTYSFLFYFGFYNFHIAIVFLFLTMALWIKYLNNDITIFSTIILLILSTLMCFSHLFVFVIFLIFVFVFAIDLFKQHIVKRENTKLIKKIILHVIVLLPGLLLLIIFFFQNPISDQQSTYLKIGELISWIINPQPAKGISYGKESKYTLWIFILFCILITYIIGSRIFLKKNKLKNGLKWGVLCILFLIMYFTIPDSKSAAIGFVSSRLVLFFYLFLIIWIAHYKVPVLLKIVVFITIMYMNIALLRIYFHTTSELNQIALKIDEASKKISANSIVLPILNSDKWMYGHISNYLGVDKPMIILENYEASLNHFPLKWNTEKIPNTYLVNKTFEQNCFRWRINKANEQIPIDYIFILEDGETKLTNICEDVLDTVLINYYQLIYEDSEKKIRLYEKN